jgi:glutamine amidotransferase
LTKSIVIIDYGVGNIFSIQHSLEYLGCNSILTNNTESILNAKGIILPGVGSYEEAMKRIVSLGLDSTIKKAVLGNKIPILGICLGMQILTSNSTEGGSLVEGLNLVDANVVKIEEGNYKDIRIPHVGFNNVEYSEGMKLFKGLPNNVDFYFTHSYKVVSDSMGFKKAHCNYYQNFIVAFEKDNIYGVQFHPEKSQENGLKMLENFLCNI